MSGTSQIGFILLLDPFISATEAFVGSLLLVFVFFKEFLYLLPLLVIVVPQFLVPSLD